ncbi:MAG: hypothetical protein ACE5IL_08025 [Myxococcota bacterium]
MAAKRRLSILGMALLWLLLPLGAVAQEASAGGDAAETPERRPTGVIWNEMLATRDQIAFQNDQEDMEKVAAQAHQLDALSLEIFNSMKDRLERRQRVQMRRSLKLIPFMVMRIADAAKRGIPGRVRDLLVELDRDLKFIREGIPDEFLADSGSGDPGSSTKPGN